MLRKNERTEVGATAAYRFGNVTPRVSYAHGFKPKVRVCLLKIKLLLNTTKLYWVLITTSPNALPLWCLPVG